jgi:hypothetical protein
VPKICDGVVFLCCRSKVEPNRKPRQSWFYIARMFIQFATIMNPFRKERFGLQTILRVISYYIVIKCQEISRFSYQISLSSACSPPPCQLATALQLPNPQPRNPQRPRKTHHTEILRLEATRTA